MDEEPYDTWIARVEAWCHSTGLSDPSASELATLRRRAVHSSDAVAALVALRAAAAELYEALDALTDASENHPWGYITGTGSAERAQQAWDAAVERARAALAKARGE